MSGFTRHEASPAHLLAFQLQGLLSDALEFVCLGFLVLQHLHSELSQGLDLYKGVVELDFLQLCLKLLNFLIGLLVLLAFRRIHCVLISAVQLHIRV